MPFGLSEQTIEQLRTVFRRHPLVKQALIYGSRAKGCHKPGSDIDLSLRGEGITATERDQIFLELDDLNLPYTIDLNIFDQIPHEPLREHIERVGMVLYP